MLSLFRRLAAASPPAPDRLSVKLDGREVSVAVRRRPEARRITLRVSSATGAVTLTLPSGVRPAEAQAFADAHRGWLAARLAKLPSRVPFEPGAAVPLRGVPHRIVHWSPVRGATAATTDPDGRPIIAVSGDAAGVPGRVRRFLSAEASRDLAAAVDRHATALGLPGRRVAVRDQRSRWGSCSSTGVLSFSWRLILAPPLVLDYLAAHEVAHLKEMNHSHRFWRLVHELCPGTEEAERWLKRHGTGLHTFG